MSEKVKTLRHTHFFGANCSKNLLYWKIIANFKKFKKASMADNDNIGIRLANTHAKYLDFLKCVSELRTCSDYKNSSLNTICIMAASHAAPQFYTSPKHALDVYYIWKKTGSMPCIFPHEKEKFFELFQKFDGILKNGQKKAMFSNMCAAVIQPASSFYIKPSFALKFYYRAKAYKRSLSRK